MVALDELDVESAEHREESVAVAFDAEAASALLAEEPTTVDFGSHAVVCVFLGRRPDTGWSVELLSALLADGVVTIRAREIVRGAGRDVVTYPADCALLTRAGLPAGEVEIRAEDTATGEFIAGTTVDVPAASSGP